DVRPALAAARIYVLPSYREGTPRSVLEAMAMGRPVITTDAPGCRETVAEGVNGLKVPPQDAAALEAAMEQLILNPEQAAAMGQASLERVRARYDVHRVNAQILSAVAD
ncbi:MAG TPA: glycosyltransferase family 1 protein, partial [Brevundimonas sp.]|nr:glycosyltransferase family 1 protein [Brevundimonas sp.]